MTHTISVIKRLLLSGFVVLAFIAYSVQQRGGKSSIVLSPPSKPQSTSNNSSGSGQSQSPSTPTSPAQPVSTYKDGTYTGSIANAFYGYIQVQVTIQAGKITNVQFLQHPQDNPNSININDQAMPYLKQEAIAAQSSHVDIISGATDTSSAFIQSISSALNQAQ